MKRKAFLHATHTTSGRLNVLRQRGLAPFADDASEPEELYRHRDFSVEDCILMRLMLNVVDNHGVSPGDGQIFAGNAWPRIGDIEGHPDYREKPFALIGADIWVGWAIDRRTVSDDPSHQWNWAAGSAEDVARRLSVRRPDGRGHLIPCRILMASISDAAEFVLSRLADAGEVSR